MYCDMLFGETNFFLDSSIESFDNQIVHCCCFTVNFSCSGDNTRGLVNAEAVTDVSTVQRIEDVSLASNVIIRRIDFDNQLTDRYSFSKSYGVVVTAEDWRIVIDVMYLIKRDTRLTNKYQTSQTFEALAVLVTNNSNHNSRGRIAIKRAYKKKILSTHCNKSICALFIRE